MLLGDILVAKGMVSPADIEQAIERQINHGGRLGDNLVALGVVTQEQLDEVFNETPQSPRNLEELDVDPLLLLQLIVKGMYSESLETPSAIVEATKLPSIIVNALIKDGVDRKLMEAVGSAQADGVALAEMRYAAGRVGTGPSIPWSRASISAPRRSVSRVSRSASCASGSPTSGSAGRCWTRPSAKSSFPTASSAAWARRSIRVPPS